MKYILTMLMTGLILMTGLVANAQTITSITEDFEDGLVGARWQPEDAAVYTLSNVDDGDENKVLKIDVDKNSGNSIGFTAIRYALEQDVFLDLTNNPYLSLRVKTDTDVPLQINLWNSTQGNLHESRIIYEVAGTGEWVTYIYDFSSSLHDTMDVTTIDTLLINFNPGWQYWYTGTVWFDDLKIGDAAAPPAGTFYADYFNYEAVNTEVYRPDENGSHVFSMEEGSLKIDVNKVSNWDGFVVDFPGTLDMMYHPLASMKIKTTQTIDLRIYLWDKDGLYEKSDVTFTISPSSGFNTYYFNWLGKFWHGAWNDPPENWVHLDSTAIESFLVNIMPGTAGDFGTVWIDDIRIGSLAEPQTQSNEKDILATTIGVISGTAIKNVPEGTTVSQLKNALTISDRATVDILVSSGGAVAGGSTEVSSTNVILVTAENLTTKEYTIQMLEVPSDALKIYKLPGTTENPTFLDVADGEIDAQWANFPANELTKQVLDLDGNGATYDGPSDISGTFKIAWNEYSLYILAEITDDNLVNNSTNTYSDDAVELFLDMTNKKNDVTTGYGSDDYQILFGYGETDAEVFIAGGALGHVYGWEQGLASGGYWMEIELDIEALFSPTGLTPEIGRLIGFDMQVDEDDGNFVVEGDGTAREHIILFNAEANENWHDPSRFGTAVFYGITSVENKAVVATKYRVYPNPVKEYLTILNGENLRNAEIYAITGQKVSGKIDFQTSSVIVTHDMLPGLYILKLTDRDGTVNVLKFMKE